MKLIHALIPALLLSIGATSASAKIMLAVSSPGNFTYAASGTPAPISGAATSVTFFAQKAGTYLLSYSAECSADNGAATNSGWVHIDVEINGVVQAPTVGASDAFCSPDNVVGSSGWVRPAITMPVTLVAGNNTVRVLGGLVSPATTGWLGDSALAIWN
jgi:hypothetical protein